MILGGLLSEEKRWPTQWLITEKWKSAFLFSTSTIGAYPSTFANAFAKWFMLMSWGRSLRRSSVGPGGLSLSRRLSRRVTRQLDRLSVVAEAATSLWERWDQPRQKVTGFVWAVYDCGRHLTRRKERPNL